MHYINCANDEANENFVSNYACWKEWWEWCVHKTILTHSSSTLVIFWNISFSTICYSLNFSVFDILIAMFASHHCFQSKKYNNSNFHLNTCNRKSKFKIFPRKRFESYSVGILRCYLSFSSESRSNISISSLNFNQEQKKVV